MSGIEVKRFSQPDERVTFELGYAEGVHELKGISGPRQIYATRVPSVPP